MYYFWYLCLLIFCSVFWSEKKYLLFLITSKQKESIVQILALFKRFICLLICISSGISSIFLYIASNTLCFISLAAALSDLTFLWKLWKIIFWLSPLLFYFLRMYTVDFVWSGQFVRGIFKSKDIDVRNCPQCHEYILKKPIRYCPHCATDRFSSNGAGYNKHCKNCGFVLKIHDFDFPCCCPHCGLAFKRKILKNEIVW